MYQPLNASVVMKDAQNYNLSIDHSFNASVVVKEAQKYYF